MNPNRNSRWSVLALAAVLAPAAMVPAAASAKSITVQVDAKSGPWTAAANKKMPFGRDPGAPVLVPLPDILGKVSIYAEGKTVSAGNGAVESIGVESKAVDDTKGPHGKVYPSLYTPKILYPANLHALVAVFVDAKGMIVGRPFVVGEGVRVEIPDGASAVSLGFNDVDFAGNSGSLKVVVEVPDE